MQQDQPQFPTTQSLQHQTGYQSLIEVQFNSKALAAGASSVRGARWPTQVLYPADAPEVIASAYYNYNRSFEALATVGEALAHVIRQGDTVTVRLAADDQVALDDAERALRDQLPEPEADASDRLSIEFSYWRDQFGVRLTSRSLEVPPLVEIEPNYPQQVRSALKEMATGFRPGSGGRLLLWHGPPGCGKTWALRAVASEWRSWCALRYVTDPERLLAEPAYLVDLIHMRAGQDRRDEGWRLIVLEDTGELLAADAKEQAGQGLSRLLNVVDGLLGESARALFLVTTNDDLRFVHPAVARPGRCPQRLEFGTLSVAEANAWLKIHGCPEQVSVPATLAELFALRDGLDTTVARREPVGFAAPAASALT